MRKYVKPWIGKQYNRRSQHGMKVLIMGESAYDWNENGRVRRASTKQIINWYWKKGQYGKSKFPATWSSYFLVTRRGSRRISSAYGIQWPTLTSYSPE